MRRAASIAAAVATLGSLTVLWAAGSTAQTEEPSVPTEPETVIENDGSQAAVKRYWTPERMQEARGFESEPDVVPSSFGTANLDFTRSRITPQTANTARPYRAVGKLFFSVPEVDDFACSGAVIDDRLVLTAAHCIYTSGSFHDNFLFVPAFDGTKPVGPKRSPFGDWTWASAVVSTAWTGSSGTLPHSNDFGILVMADQSFGGDPIPIAKRTKSFETATGLLFDNAVTMLGYPANFDSGNIMQRVDSSDHRPGGAGTTTFEYGSDMDAGSSGGPWVQNFGDPKSAAPAGGTGFAIRNAIVGVGSYKYNDPAVLVQGASELNANFTTIKETACSSAPGNC